MSYRTSFAMSALFVLCSLSLGQMGRNNSGYYHRSSSLMFEPNSIVVCLFDGEIATALKKLSSSQTASEQENIKNQLVKYGKSSNACRTRVIAALIRAMDLPNLDLTRDRPSFYLWHYGTEMLGDLKAVEALDLLIKHLDLNDGTPFPMNHHPALVGVIRMGAIAIPKLNAVLRMSTDRYTRRYVVFCIASIGGTSAKQALEDALSSESDECLRGFLQTSLQAFRNRKAPNQVGSDAQSKWYSAFLCDGT